MAKMLFFIVFFVGGRLIHLVFIATAGKIVEYLSF